MSFSLFFFFFFSLLEMNIAITLDKPDALTYTKNVKSHLTIMSVIFQLLRGFTNLRC